METSLLEDDNLEDDGQEFLINFPPEVQKAIEQVSFLTSLLYVKQTVTPQFSRYYPARIP